MEPFPDWLAPLPDAERMRAIDRWAIDQRGVPSLELMERAGAGVTRAVERLAPDGPVAVVCGKGNNGGDGLVVARLLRHAGRPVSVICTAPVEELRGDAEANLKRLPGPPPTALAQARSLLEEAGVIVDALLGTGFAGEPHGPVLEAIEAIAACSAPVVSVDVPSGVDSSSGVVAGAAVSATATVTFHAAKPGLWIDPGKAHAGALEVLDIGIPRGAPLQADIGLITPAVLALLPRREAQSTKFSSGHVIVVGGSRGLTGAPRMAALGAMRAGAGYVTACVPESLQAILACGPPELMTIGLPDDAEGLIAAAAAPALEAAHRGGALALGPGLGRRDGAQAFARELARTAALPLVLDADGLNAHADHGGERLGGLAARPAPTVLTPHAGELGRLLDLDSEHISAERLAHARAAAQTAQATVVLKGDDTLVADPGGLVAVSPGDSPALATAGTGDVLSGVIAALLAEGLSAFIAASAGVCLHAEAGRLAAWAQGAAEGVVASDVIAMLPRAHARGVDGASDLQAAPWLFADGVAHDAREPHQGRRRDAAQGSRRP
ncbi:MAG TPA: NAD(P)H-hydrate dehydratase [Solirubrobacteraceae bacterium]|nr:NAD(P)H-hydrate dehydratase [Solirubrobacteraceae bacterium]